VSSALKQVHYLLDVAADVGQMWYRCGADVVQMWGRCGADVGQM